MLALFTVIVAITTVLVPIGCLNIDDVTWLLTLPVTLWGSRYQVMARPLQGSRRSCKTPHYHHYNYTQYHCLHCPPHQWCKKQMNLTVNNTQNWNKGQNWSCARICAYLACMGGAENPHGGFPLWVPLSCPFTITIGPLLNDSKNRRPSQRSSSKNAIGITQKVVCKIFTHIARSSGAENSVHQMGGNVGLPSTMVGSGSRVPAYCGGWQHQWTKSGKTTEQHLCRTFYPLMINSVAICNGLRPWSCVTHDSRVTPRSADAVLRQPSLVSDRVQVSSGGYSGEYAVGSMSQCVPSDHFP